MLDTIGLDNGHIMAIDGERESVSYVIGAEERKCRNTHAGRQLAATSLNRWRFPGWARTTARSPPALERPFPFIKVESGMLFVIVSSLLETTGRKHTEYRCERFGIGQDQPDDNSACIA